MFAGRLFPCTAPRSRCMHSLSNLRRVPTSRLVSASHSKSPFIHLQKRYAGSEPSKINEDEQLDMARRHKGEGSIMAVQSGLFKLLLPLPEVPETSLAKRMTPVKDKDAVMFLLHPRQPLSIIATLIEAELSAKGQPPLEVTFHGADEHIPSSSSSSSSHHDAESSASSSSASPSPPSSSSNEAARGSAEPETHQWAQATELGDFVQEAAKDRKFVIAIKEHASNQPKILKIRVPSFEERTRFLRERLLQVTKDMHSLLDIKSECDLLALKGARRMALAGFGGLLSYWGGVYFLTFHVYGWDVMEPVTYLTGLTGLMSGYLWFLYNNREISYRSVFEMSSSKRREQLYDAKGFDRQQWQDLVDEGTELRRAIKKIAHDYSVNWSMEKELTDDKATAEIKKHEKGKFGDKAPEAEIESGGDQHASARAKS